jgi:hypothetical protein
MAFAQKGTIMDDTLNGKLIMGYQGWFGCPGDQGSWFHWSSQELPTTDMLPDTADYQPGSKCTTPYTTPGGAQVDVFSSLRRDVVDRHFIWMRDYGLDGVALQRFGSQLRRPEGLQRVDTVLANVRHAAEANGRVFFIMYDLSGLNDGDLAMIAADWKRLQSSGLTMSPAYLHHRGHPLLGLWGLGFRDRPLTPGGVRDFLTSITQISTPQSGLTLMGGLPSGWRTGTGDAAGDPAWQAIWPKLGVISPWTVGRYVDDAGADRYRKTVLEPDLQATRTMGVDYLPVVFPGFSWANVMRARHADAKAIPNQIPRRCGRFYWRQVFNAVSAGATMIYGAMFDEVDEGTAMFKIVPSAAQVPGDGTVAGEKFVTLDADGCKLPSDWYLRLAGSATKALRHEIPLSPDLPLRLPPN